MAKTTRTEAFLPRRVLMTADAVGGAFTEALELARGLSRLRTEVILAVLGPLPSREQRRRAETVPLLSLVPHESRLEWMDDPWDELPGTAAWLADLSSVAGPDLVHLHGFTQGGTRFGAPVVLAARSCLLSRWKAVRGGRPPRSTDRYRDLVRAALRTADVLVAPTSAMLSSLEEHHGKAAHAMVVPGGRDANAFVPGEKEPVVVAEGLLWDEAEGAALLDEIAEGISWPVVAAGAVLGPSGERFAPGRVRLAGPLDEESTARVLAGASVFVSTARYEPSGLGPLPAALSGCALVLSDLPPFREVWGEAALYVPPGDADAFAATIQALIKSPAVRAHLGRRARVHALRYDPARLLHGTLRAYGEAARHFAGAVPLAAAS